jgi:hypothetical protein
MAWLHAAPRPDPDSQRGKAAAESKIKPVSRLEELRKQKIEPAMPPNPAPHIIDRLLEMGITEGEMSAKPLSWCEIVAWQQGVWVRLAPWEARLIRRLSAAYVTESRAAESENCPAPWHSGPDQRAIDTEQARLMAVLG